VPSTTDYDVGHTFD